VCTPFLSRPSLGLIAAVSLLAACGDGGGPDKSVLTSLVVSPTSAAVYNSAPGNTVTLTVTGKDQNGATMVGVGSPSFASSNTGVATVSAAGVVTAVAAGTAQITASLQDEDVTKTAPMTVTVQVAPAVASVGSTGVPQPAYVPATVHLASGGEVIWTFGGVEHSITFTSIGSPTSIPSLMNGSDSRTFPSSGTFNYHCDFHPSMLGTVFVH